MGYCAAIHVFFSISESQMLVDPASPQVSPAVAAPILENPHIQGGANGCYVGTQDECSPGLERTAFTAFRSRRRCLKGLHWPVLSAVPVWLAFSSW
jgi:hypothetical protein